MIRTYKYPTIQNLPMIRTHNSEPPDDQNIQVSHNSEPPDDQNIQVSHNSEPPDDQNIQFRTSRWSEHTIQNLPMIRTYKYPMNYHTQIDKQAKIYLLKNGKFTKENTFMINFTTQLFFCIFD
jgi:hypothetical protein